MPIEPIGYPNSDGDRYRQILAFDEPSGVVRQLTHSMVKQKRLAHPLINFKQFLRKFESVIRLQ